MPVNVLVVDDEAVFRNYIRDMAFWEKGEFRLAGECRNTEEAMRFLEAEETDIVILDVSMPGKNGVVLSGMIAGRYPSVSMVAVSSFDDYDYVRQILKNGAHDYILKHRLTGGQLEETLYAVRDRRRGVSAWESKSKLRRQAHAWFFGGGESPFTSDNSRKAVMLVQILFGKEMTESGRIAVAEGIARIFEENSAEKTDVLALFKAPDRFVILTRFYDRVSEAGMKEQLEYHKRISEDTISRIYALKLTAEFCPVFFSDSAMRSYLLHKLEQKEESVPESMTLTLTIRQQKELLLAMEEGDGPEAEALIHHIFAEIREAGQSACLLIVRELLELIQKAVVEYRITLDFLPEDFGLYEYAKMRDKEKLAASIAGLYSNVIREIGEQKKEEAGFPGIVEKAVSYLKKNYDKPISLRTVAAGIGTNSSYLSRVFHEETGKTITDYMNEIRIEAAKKMLAEGYALKEIAGKSGFKNYTYFLKIFKDYTGMTPKEYRKPPE